MTYAKPGIVLTANATRAIQGSNHKWFLSFCLDADCIQYNAILPAYEADE